MGAPEINLGIPAADRGQLLTWSDALLSSLSGKTEHVADAAEAFFEFNSYARRAIETGGSGRRTTS